MSALITCCAGFGKGNGYHRAGICWCIDHGKLGFIAQHILQQLQPFLSKAHTAALMAWLSWLQRGGGLAANAIVGNGTHNALPLAANGDMQLPVAVGFWL